MSESKLRELSMEFSVEIIELVKYLKSIKESIISNQIGRSGTSIGANIAEAECGISKKDFLAKMYIAFKECSETKYWLELLFATDYLNETEYNSIIADCDELLKLLTSITKTAKAISNEK